MPELPEPYVAEADQWTAPDGARRAEAKAARAALGRGEEAEPDEQRRRLLLDAAGADVAALLTERQGGWRTRLVHQAAGRAMLLWYHDRRHGTARGSYPAEDPHWTEEIESRREYTRQEWTAYLAPDARGPVREGGESADRPGLDPPGLTRGEQHPDKQAHLYGTPGGPSAVTKRPFEPSGR